MLCSELSDHVCITDLCKMGLHSTVHKLLDGDLVIQHNNRQTVPAPRQNQSDGRVTTSMQ